ncbi:ZIP family metal transporter [Wenzhouxiangella sp. AB-CW3]|uniref:ZIP family metal transporter n=1 Tax=Wenzhouxiangella sp. AB-CW3 TaxID=2771012 RepID=UPI00168AF891|nr:ZIP family metal transporter [Wenzhouxiangella sp. AB-CW3]QOC22658.1 ZIP family metal transporter [Wenzhouxiangella sp. AB-CW3]
MIKRIPADERPLSLATALALLSLLAGIVYLSGLAWPRMSTWLAGLSSFQLGFLASFVAGMFTAVGALPIFMLRRISQATEDALMGFGAGVMLAATAFELVLPAVELAETQYGSVSMALAVLILGVGIGGGMFLVLQRLVPQERFRIGLDDGADATRARGIYLFIFAIALHNLPEGLAVGVGFGGDVRDGITLAIAIGLQNMPEGLIVAVAMMSLGYGKWPAFGMALLTGLVQPVGGLIGAAAVSLSQAMLPWGMAFAGGAMLFVISHEIIPGSHKHGYQTRATAGVLIGFITLLAIDLSIG